LTAQLPIKSCQPPSLYEEFDDPDVLDTSDSDVSIWDIEDGAFRLGITEP
jgi:hypothetical protein